MQDILLKPRNLCTRGLFYENVRVISSHYSVTTKEG